MIISMSDILCITNRSLCNQDFYQQIELIVKAHPAGIVLREKDLSETEYRDLAQKVMKICKVHAVPCMLHSFVNIAIELQADAIHLPLPILRDMTKEQKSYFTKIGASCHSVADALEAQTLGCTYITAGHIFATDCKKGLPGRGIDFLQSVCQSVSIPVYAIGGINGQNIAAIRHAGADGACIMSGLMQCENPQAYLHTLSK